MSSQPSSDDTMPNSSMNTRSRSRQQAPYDTTDLNQETKNSEIATVSSMVEIGVTEDNVTSDVPDNYPSNKRARLATEKFTELNALVSKSANMVASISTVPYVPPAPPVPTFPKRASTKKTTGTRRRSVNHKHMKILSPVQRATLKGIVGQEILKDMAFYMQHVLGNSRENIKNVMNKVMMLVNGYGVRHQTSTFPGNVFKQGIPITLDHDFAAMDIEANDWVHAHGGDVSHGWLIKLPLRKMWVYQVARFERGGPFLDPNAMPDPALSHYYANAAFNPNGLPRVPGSRKPRRSPKQKIQDLLKNDYMNQAQRDLLNVPATPSPNVAVSASGIENNEPTTPASEQLETLPSDYNKQYYEVSNTAEV